MSRKLGNSRKVVLTHYLPEPLLVAWNTRLIRRFQNLWLMVAAGNEDFLLDVTDFNTVGQLHAFLADMMMQHSPTSSPLALELHNRLTWLLNDDSKSRSTFFHQEGNLAVPVSKQSLAVLYLYQECALDSGVTPDVLDAPDIMTGLRPRQFIDLAEILRHQLPSHRDVKVRKAHDAAKDLVTTMRSDIHWGDLLTKKG